jgi:hypothetical protein
VRAAPVPRAVTEASIPGSVPAEGQVRRPTAANDTEVPASATSVARVELLADHAVLANLSLAVLGVLVMIASDWGQPSESR